MVADSHAIRSSPKQLTHFKKTVNEIDFLLARIVERLGNTHVTAMMNKKRGLEGKCALQYVNRDVTSLLLHVPET